MNVHLRNPWIVLAEPWLKTTAVECFENKKLFEISSVFWIDLFINSNLREIKITLQKKIPKKYTTTVARITNEKVFRQFKNKKFLK